MLTPVLFLLLLVSCGSALVDLGELGGTTLEEGVLPISHPTMYDTELEGLALCPVKRQRLETNWSKCLLCQRRTKERHTIPGEQGIKRLLTIARLRSDDVLFRLQPDIENIWSVGMKWHPSCYSNYTSKSNLQQCTKMSNQETPTQTPTPNTRLSTGHGSNFNTAQCVICQKRRDKSSNCKLMQVSTLAGEQSLLTAARLRNDDVFLRINGTNLIASEVKYHKSCRSAYVAPRNLMFSPKLKTEHGLGEDVMNESSSWKSSFEKLLLQIDKPLMCDGKGMELTAVCRIFNTLLAADAEEGSTCTCDNRRLRTLLKRHYGDQLTFEEQHSKAESHMMLSSRISRGDVVMAVTQLASPLPQSNVLAQTTEMVPDPHEDTVTDQAVMTAAYETATKLKKDVRMMDAGDDDFCINRETAAKLLPDGLYFFLRCLLADEVDSGTNIRDLIGSRHPDDGMDSIILSLGQDIVYQVSKRRQPTPKHVGIALAVHQATRSKDLVSLIHAAGNCISYEQLQRIDTAIAMNHLHRFEENGNIIVPENLVAGRFVHYAGDNIDILEETVDGKGTFHATQMAAFQVGPARTPEAPIPMTGRERVLKSLPPEFHEIIPVNMPSKRPTPTFPPVDLTNLGTGSFGVVNQDDLPWLLGRAVKPLGQKVPAWTGFHRFTSGSQHAQDVVGYMPIIHAPAHEYDTLWTVILRAQNISEHLGQKHTVITFDQALYCRAKELSWLRPRECQHLIIRLGGFHTVMNFLHCIGQHFADSGLEDVWVESGLISECTASKILEGKKWNVGIRTHKLSLEAAWRCLWPIFLHWCETSGHELPAEMTTMPEELAASLADKDPDKARSVMQQMSPEMLKLHKLLAAFERAHDECSTVVYWMQYLKMVTTVLAFLRAEREGNWRLHLSALAEMMPFFMVYDHTNYARWGPVYYMDMQGLATSAPEVYQEFEAGHFGVRETTQPFNQIHADQALEHVNRSGKIAGGLVGITRTSSAMDRWSLTYNDRSYASDCTYKMFGLNPDPEVGLSKHKDGGPSRIQRDEEDVARLTRQFQHYNIFEYTDPELVCLSTKDVAPAEVKTDLLSAMTRGNQYLEEYINKRLSPEATTGFYDPLKKHRSKTFGDLYKVEAVTSTGVTKTIKADRDLFRRLLVASQAGRDIKLGALFKHELAPIPLGLAKTDGHLNPADKAPLAHILEGETPLDELPETQQPACCVIDAMAVVQAIGKPREAATFGDLADAFTANILSYFRSSCTRIDVVFDCYRDDSIKGTTRQRRAGKSRAIRRLISGRDVPLPAKWPNFISLSANKANLAEFLSNQLVAIHVPVGCELVVAGGFSTPETVVSSTRRPTAFLESNQEEADTRMVLHAEDAAQCGYHRVVIASQDTDVLVLLVHFAHRLTDEVWMRAGTSKKRRYIPIHTISQNHSREVCMFLPAFHAFTGCDTTSQFSGHGKKSCWKVFATHPERFRDLGVGILKPDTEATMEEFTVQLYDPSSELSSVDEQRSHLFNSRSPEKLPPTADALLLHTKRAHYQTMVWLNALVPKPQLPAATEHGWTRDDDCQLKPKLMTLPAVPTACLELVTCGCKASCTSGRCSCRSNKLSCTTYCGCVKSTTPCVNPHNPTETVDTE